MDEGSEVPERPIPEPVWRRRLEDKGGAAGSLRQATERKGLIQTLGEQQKAKWAKFDPRQQERPKTPEPKVPIEKPRFPIPVKELQEIRGEKQSPLPPKIQPTEKRGVLPDPLRRIRRALKPAG